MVRLSDSEAEQLLTGVDKKYLKARDMYADERSMRYIAQKLGYKHASGVNWLLKEYDRKPVLDKIFPHPQKREEE